MDSKPFFSEVGRMCPAVLCTTDMFTRSKKHPSCMAHILVSPEGSALTIETAEEAEAAITTLNSTDIIGQIITVEKVSHSSVADFLHV